MLGTWSLTPEEAEKLKQQKDKLTQDKLEENKDKSVQIIQAEKAVELPPAQIIKSEHAEVKKENILNTNSEPEQKENRQKGEAKSAEPVEEIKKSEIKAEEPKKEEKKLEEIKEEKKETIEKAEADLAEAMLEKIVNKEDKKQDNLAKTDSTIEKRNTFISRTHNLDNNKKVDAETKKIFAEAITAKMTSLAMNNEKHEKPKEYIDEMNKKIEIAIKDNSIFFEIVKINRNFEESV